MAKRKSNKNKHKKDKKNRSDTTRRKERRVLRDLFTLESFKEESPYRDKNNLNSRKLRNDILNDRKKVFKDYKQNLNTKLKVGAISSDEHFRVQKQLNEEIKHIRRLEVCNNRKYRRESLFSLNLIGKGKGSRKKHIFKPESKVRC